MAADEERTQAIRQVVAEAEARQLDLEPFLELHTPDTVLVNFGGRRVLGRDELRRAMAAALDTPMAQVLTRSEIDDIRFLRPDVALVSCTKHVEDRREAAPDDARFAARGHLTYVVVEDQGGWRIALAQTTPIAGS